MNLTGEERRCDRRDVHPRHDWQADFGAYHDVTCPGNDAGLGLLPAARLVVSLDDAIRQYPGDPRRGGSTRDKKDKARLNGALSVWEALTGLPAGDALEEARRLVRDTEPSRRFHVEDGSPCDGSDLAPSISGGPPTTMWCRNAQMRSEVRP
jgi:hypothetical protein